MNEFDELHQMRDSHGEVLDWEWDDEQMMFVAYGSDLRTYMLRPLTAELEITGEDGAEEEEDDYEDDDL